MGVIDPKPGHKTMRHFCRSMTVRYAAIQVVVYGLLYVALKLT
jgi:hypothetical protein